MLLILKLFLMGDTVFNPHENGFLLFVLGIIFVLTIYHFLLFFQHKSKTFIFYATYTFLLFLSYFTFTENDVLDTFTKPAKPFFSLTHQFWVWAYNIAYYFFAFRFLNFQKHYPKQEKFIKKGLLGLLALGVLGFFTSLFYQNDVFLAKVYITIYVPVILLLTLYCFYLVYKTPEKTRFYILIGSFVLFLSSLITILIIDFNVFTSDDNVGFTIFYIGIVIENMFFSLGLGMRQKQILLERNEAKNNLIIKLQENEDLKGKINIELHEKIKVLNQQIKLQEELEALKLEAFKSQMNPHFIFNALNSIKHYIVSNEQKNAVHYLNKFSKLIRKILELSAVKQITLEEELQIIELYLNIENMRFSNEIEIVISVEENVNMQQIKIPPLLLQPFLENAIWHGLSSKKGIKKIKLTVCKTSPKFVTIKIEDNGIGRKAAAKIKAQKITSRKSIGIQLTKERLQNFTANFAETYTLNFKDLVDENEVNLGTKVVLELPLE